MKVILKPYKGYKAELVYDREEKFFHGEVVDLASHIKIGIEGKTIEQAERDFHEAIEHLLEFEEEDLRS